MSEGTSENEGEVEYSPDPVRLVRNIWMKSGDVGERVKIVKFMWGIFACNELIIYLRDLAWESRCNVTCVLV
jgi:hypothetical protein